MRLVITDRVLNGKKCTVTEGDASEKELFNAVVALVSSLRQMMLGNGASDERVTEVLALACAKGIGARIAKAEFVSTKPFGRGGG